MSRNKTISGLNQILWACSKHDFCCLGHGYDDSCPSGHSESFCNNYQNGYNTQWSITANSDMQNGGNGNGNSNDNSAQSPAIGGNNLGISGNNNQVTINQGQSQK